MGQICEKHENYVPQNLLLYAWQVCHVVACKQCEHFGAWLYLTLQNPLYQKCYLFCLCCLWFVVVFVVCLFVFLFVYLGFLPATMFSHLQFHLNVGLVGVTYSAITLTYAVGTILTGPITDRLVRSTLHTAGFVGLDSHRISPFTAHLPSHTHVQKRPRYFIITGLVIAGAGFQFIGPAEFITSPYVQCAVAVQTMVLLLS